MSRNNIKSSNAITVLIQKNKKLWEDADIIPKIRHGKVVKNNNELQKS